MKEIFNILKKLLWKKRKFAFLFYFSLFLNIICWLILIWLFHNEQSFVVLHYNAFLGIDVVVNMDLERNYFQMYFAPLAGTFFLVFNFMIATALGMFADFSQMDISSPKESFGLKEIKTIDPGILGIYIILSGSLILQISILLHVVSLVFVNR